MEKWRRRSTPRACDETHVPTATTRKFIAGLGSALAWPLVAGAQQTTVPVVGSLHGITATQGADRIAAFRNGLGEMGFIEGRNVSIEYRWAEGQVERLPALAGEKRFDICVAASAHSPARSPPAKQPITSGTQAMREIHRNLL